MAAARKRRGNEAAATWPDPDPARNCARRGLGEGATHESVVGVGLLRLRRQRQGRVLRACRGECVRGQAADLVLVLHRRRRRASQATEQTHARSSALRVRAFADEFGGADVTLDPAIRPVAVCWFEKNDAPGAVPFLTAPDLLTFLNSLASSSACTAAISTFVRPRSELDPACYANLEHEFTYVLRYRLYELLCRLTLD